MLDTNPKAMQEISCIGNVDGTENATMFFIIEEAKETFFYFSQEAMRVLQTYFTLINEKLKLKLK